MSPFALLVLVGAASGAPWQPPCETPGSFGAGLPDYCHADQDVRVVTPHFTARVEAGLRYGVCEDDRCLEVRAADEIPPNTLSVHTGALKGRLEGVIDLADLADRLSGPMRPCEVASEAGEHWVHCRYDFGEHPAAQRLDEGDYYRLHGQGWLGVRYTLSRDGGHPQWQQRLQRFLDELKPRTPD